MTSRVATPSLRQAWRELAGRLAAAGIDADEAGLEAEILLRHVLGMERAAFLVQGDALLDSDSAATLERLARRRVKREPLAYILGQRAFYGLELGVDRRVLVPRPETEGLVERTVAFAGRRAGEGLTIADIGTGSGCIAIALAVALPRARIIAVDAAPGALAVARQNARRHGAARRIAFRRGDLLAPLRGAVDIIVSNPPYVACGEIAALAPEIAGFEPRQALDGGADGLDVIRRLVADAPRWLTPGGALFVEIGDRQGALAADLARRAFAASAISVERDLAGKVRYLCVLT